MLCDLARAYLNGKQVSITSACIASHIPVTTALAHLKLLADDGLAERRPDPDDRRRHHLTITDKGFAIVKAAFLPCVVMTSAQPGGSRPDVNRSAAFPHPRGDTHVAQ
jgi:hypothetical protein